jgi:hypothetical protein
MPPGPVYNWLCVLHSAASILSHVARIRAEQAVARSASSTISRKRKRSEVELTPEGQNEDKPRVRTGMHSSDSVLARSTDSEILNNEGRVHSESPLIEASRDGTVSPDVANPMNPIPPTPYKVRTFPVLVEPVS